MSQEEPQEEALHPVSELTRLVFHPGHITEQQSASKVKWTPEQDLALALAVRTSLFDFAAAARALSTTMQCDADSCQRRWAELDLHACTALSARLDISAKSLDAPPTVTPSGFNIFEDSLGDKILSLIHISEPTRPY